MKRGALGLIETRGLVSALEACDAMVKAANVDVVDVHVVGSGLVTVIIEGEVAAVQSAIEIGCQRCKNLGQLISSNVIARPHEDVCKLLDILK
jgi:ethanolamine utilization protein EutM